MRMPSAEIVNRTTRGCRAPYSAMVNPPKSMNMPKRKLLNTSATTKNPMVKIPTAQYQSGDFLTYAYSGASHEMVSGNEGVACSVGVFEWLDKFRTYGILASLAHKNKSLHRSKIILNYGKNGRILLWILPIKNAKHVKGERLRSPSAKWGSI